MNSIRLFSLSGGCIFFIQMLQNSEITWVLTKQYSDSNSSFNRLFEISCFSGFPLSKEYTKMFVSRKHLPFMKFISCPARDTTFIPLDDPQGVRKT